MPCMEEIFYYPSAGIYRINQIGGNINEKHIKVHKTIL